MVPRNRKWSTADSVVEDGEEGHTPTGKLRPQNANEATPTQRKLHTQPCFKHPCRILPPTTQRTATARQGPCAMPPQPLPTNATGQASPSTSHCNNSPGRNIIQLSSTIATQLIQMLVTPHPKRGHNTPTPHTANPSCHSPAHRPDPPSEHDNQRSSTPPSNHTANARSPRPLVDERETYAGQEMGPGRPTAPGPAQPASHRSTGTRHATQFHPPEHPTSDRSHRRKHWR
ncbi:hypothetical protein CRENBAI_022353 [Crenichthys baileyi]|uniref:Uncharacterized protein n=1 Tax=Crenichthys baileyi TaxID=28760 RepID=A0AAV9RM92_9TELE